MMRFHFRRASLGFAAAVVFTFAIGVGASTALFSFVDALVLRRLPFRDPGQLVRIQPVRGGRAGQISALEVRDIETHATLLEDVASFRGSQYVATGTGPPENLRATMASYNLFRTLGVRPMLGTTWSRADDGTRVFTVVLSHDAWQRRFGADSSIVGRAVTLDAYAYTVLGILPRGFAFPEGADVYRRVPAQDLEHRDVRTAAAVGRMKRGVSVAQLQRELDAISTRLADAFPETNRGVRFVASPLRDYWMGSSRPYLAALGGAVACVFLLVCVNVAALLLARGVAREHELAVRAALGASRARLARQLVVEILILALAGAAIGLLTAHGSARALDALVGASRPSWMRVAFDARIATFAVLCAAIAAIAAGLGPALRGSISSPINALRAGGRSATGVRIAPLHRLVMVQFALAVVLVSGAGIMGRSLAELRAAPLGFETGALLTFKIDPPWTRYDRIGATAPFYRRMLAEVRQVPGVIGATTDHAPPIAGLGPHDGPHKNLPTAEGEDATVRDQKPFVNLHLVAPDYFAAMGVRLERGRGIGENDDDPWAPVAVISASLASTLWPSASALGRRIQLGELDANYNYRLEATDTVPRWATVVGVAGDVHDDVLARQPGLDLYVSNQQYFTPETYVLVRTRGEPRAVLRAVEQAVWRVDPGIAVFDVRTMSERVDDSIWQLRLAGALSAGFGAIALLLSAVGLYGTLGFATEQRRAEFAIRGALGSDAAGILRLVLREAAVVVGAGVAVGLAATIASIAVSSRLLTGLGTRDPAAVALAVAALATVAFAAAYVPARRSSRVAPADALRR